MRKRHRFVFLIADLIGTSANGELSAVTIIRPDRFVAWNLMPGGLGLEEMPPGLPSTQK